MKKVLFKGVDLTNAVVRCLNEGDGEKIIKFFKSKGFNIERFGGMCYGEDVFYGCVNGVFHWYSSEELRDYTHIFELSDILEEEKTFPRRMLVGDYEDEITMPSIVIHDLGEQFDLRFISIREIDEERCLNGETGIKWDCWKYAKEIVTIEPTQMTVEEMRQELEQLKGTKIDVV